MNTLSNFYLDVNGERLAVSAPHREGPERFVFGFPATQADVARRLHGKDCTLICARSAESVRFRVDAVDERLHVLMARRSPSASPGR